MTLELGSCNHTWREDGGERVCSKCGRVDDEVVLLDPVKLDGYAQLPVDHHDDDKRLIKRIQQQADYNHKDVGKEGRLLAIHDLFSGESSWVEELKDDLRVQLQEAGIGAGVIAAQLKRLDRKLEVIQEDFKAEVVGAFQPYFKEAMKRKVLYALRSKEDNR
jgi:hypothetical protein